MPVWPPTKLFREWRAELAARRAAERNKTQTIDIGKVELEIVMENGATLMKTLYGRPVLWAGFNGGEPAYHVIQTVQEAFKAWRERSTREGFFQTDDSSELIPTRGITRICPTYSPHEVTLRIYREEAA